ncbi:tRNA pseudouridine synthase D [candidate division SR1 bacterium]|nr:tRNA pseudouridine synthase D [candidate division SR1 bacterium]
MLYQFKTKPEDFLVQELLPQRPSGKGDVFWVLFEKRNLTTMDVLDYLQRSLNLTRNDFGIAGLKDKIGITQQRITIFQSKLNQSGGQTRFLSILGEKVKILHTTRNETPLRIGGNAGNNFEIRLRSTQKATDDKPNPEIKSFLEQNIAKIKSKGFPNCFGQQRFGKGFKNFREAREILCNGEAEKQSLGQDPTFHLRFMLQAYPSMYFNQYALMRRKKGLHILQGDICVDKYYADGAKIVKETEGIPTGPMLGRDLMLPKPGTKARIREDILIKEAGFDEKVAKKCQEYHLRGVRRPLRVYVPDLEYQRVKSETAQQKIKQEEKADLILKFSLPTGSYATTLLAFILEGLDEKTIQENKLTIPRLKGETPPVGEDYLGSNG